VTHLGNCFRRGYDSCKFVVESITAEAGRAGLP